MDAIRFGALKAKNFRWYFLGMGISLCGSWLQYVALGWLIYNLNHSAILLGLNSLIGGIPLLIFPLFFGGFIDKFNKRKLLLITQILFCIQALTLAFLTINHNINYLMIMILSLFSGIIIAIDQPLRQALIPDLIDKKEDLPNAIAWNAFLNNFSRMISPALAGFFIFEYGEGVCFLIDAISFAIMIFVIYQINWQSFMPALVKKSFYDTWHQGFNYIKKSALIKQALLLTLITSSTLGTYTLVMPIITQNIYHGDSKSLGYLLTASGVAAIVASLLMTAQNKELKSLIRKIILGSIGAVFSVFILINTTLLLLGLVSIMFLSGSMIVIVISLNTIIQISAEDDERGFIMSFFTAAYLGTIPLSNFSVSWLIDQIGIKPTMISLALIYFVGFIYFFINTNVQSVAKATLETE